MIITYPNRKAKNLYELESGDIFKYCGDYCIAGDIMAIDNYRECFNLNRNIVMKLKYNPLVEYWNGNEVELKLYEREDQK